MGRFIKLYVDTTWSISGSPYILTGNITIQGTDGDDGITTLTIEPGADLRFNPSFYLFVGGASGAPGAIVAVGEPDNPITFTSNRTSPWNGIYFRDTSDDNACVLDYCTIEKSSSYAVRIDSANPAIRHSTIRQSKYGIYLYDSSPELTGNTITDNSHDAIYCTSNTSTPLISGNTISSNGSNIMNIGANVNLVGNIISGRPDQGIRIIKGTISRDITWPNYTVPYIIAGILTIQGTDGEDGITTLTIEPGTEIRINSSYLIFIGGESGDPGAIEAVGDPNNPITFTSNITSPWHGLYFRNTSDDNSCVLDYCIVEKTPSHAVRIDSANPTIRHSTIRQSRDGIYLFDSSPELTGNIITGNSRYAIYCSSNTSVPSISGNTLSSDGSNLMRIGANVNPVSNIVSGSPDQGILIIKDTITHDITWPNYTVPYVIMGNITVKGKDGADGITSLTIEAGTHIKFNSNYYFGFGEDSGEPGSLIAQGTPDNMIVFTSAKATPAPGNWYSLRFYETGSENPLMEYCVVEYGGSYKEAIYIGNTNLTLKNSIIRNSSTSGLSVAGTGSSGSNIQCNTFENNRFGITTTDEALPLIENNNFINNTIYGVSSRSNSTVLVAKNNWWNDVAGPDQSGDMTYGDIDTVPWSTEPNLCLSEVNHPPNQPSTPTPADNAVRISASATTLGWTGGDPDAQDTVVYDIYLGLTSDTLSLNAQNVVNPRHIIYDQTPGITYYWQVIARDNKGMETSGPVWSFTTNGRSPDLTIGQVVTEPPGHLQTDQNISISVVVLNSGSGPVVDSFSVDFKINGVSIGTQTVDTIILAGQSVELFFPWTYSGDNPTLDIFADNLYHVVETNNQNNHFIAPLFDVADMTAPSLENTWPVNGAYLNEVGAISMILADSQSQLDNAAIIAGFALTDSSQQAIPGGVTKTNETFTFVPTSVPLSDGSYTASLVSADIHGNTQNYNFSFTVDSQPPTKPAITGGTVTSGTIQARPFLNTANQFIVELTGTREADSAVLVSGVERIVLGDGPWSVQVELQPGDNAIEAKLKDRAENIGEAEWVDIHVSTANTIQFDYNASGRIEHIETTP